MENKKENHFAAVANSMMSINNQITQEFRKMRESGLEFNLDLLFTKSSIHMISINEYSHISRISNRSINYEFINASLRLNDMRFRSSAEHYDLQKKGTCKMSNLKVLKVGDEVEICSYPSGGTEKRTTKIIEVGATSDMSTKTFYKTETGALFYLKPELGTNRHYNLGNRAFWIENPYISKNICSQCDYYLHGNPSVCNAFHEPGVSSCIDFQDKNTTEKLKQEERKQELRNFCYEIYLKINIFRNKSNHEPSRIVLHPIRYEHICDYLRSGMYPFGHEMDGVLIFCDTEVILSSSVPENYIGLVIDTIE